MDLELKEIVEKGIGSVLCGTKRIELESCYWNVEVYRLKTTIRVDIKRKHSSELPMKGNS